MSSTESAALVVADGKLLVDALGTPLVLGSLAAGEIPDALTFADRAGGTVVLRANDDAMRAAIGGGANGAHFVDPMFDLGRYAPGLRAHVVRALAIERWAARERFCSRCGRPLRVGDGISLTCDSEPPHRHFPRIDPAVIVLVTHRDRALLGRAARWPAGWYSTLAGFVEPGETLEATIRREVDEEAGVRVDGVRYHGSEPWPFPRSLMLGFFAQALGDQIVLRDGELEDARWFSRADVAELLARMRDERPHFDTIARRLMTAFATDAGSPLER